MRRFLDQFYPCIEKSTPHLYLSTLPWLPKGLKISAAWRNSFPSGWILQEPIQDNSAIRILHNIHCQYDATAVSVSHNRSIVAVGDRRGNIHMYNIHTSSPVWESRLTHDDYLGRISKVAFSPTSDMLVCCHNDVSVVSVWRPANNQTWTFQRQCDHGSAVCCLCFSGDGSLLATGCQDGLLHLWDHQEMMKSF